MKLLAVALKGPARGLWVVWATVLCGGCFGKEDQSTLEVVPQEICIEDVPGILAGPFPAQIGTVTASVEWPKSEEVTVTFSVIVIPFTPGLEFDIGATTILRPEDRRLKNRYEAAIQVYATAAPPAEFQFSVEATVRRFGKEDYSPSSVDVVVRSSACVDAPEPHFTRFEPERITLLGTGDTAGEIRARIEWQDEEVLAVDLSADTTTGPSPVEFTIGDVHLDGAGSFEAPFTARPLISGPATGAFDIVADIHGATRDASIRQRVEYEIVASAGSDLIVFSNKPPGGGDGEIWVMDAAGGSQMQLTDNNREDWDPAWAPDRSRIAFVSNSEGQGLNLDLMVMDPDGANRTPVTDLESLNVGFTTIFSARDPAWSPVPGQHRIAVAVGANGFFDEIWIFDLDQPAAPPVKIDAGTSREVEHPAWSQDGSEIAFCNLGATYVVPADGSSAPTILVPGLSLDWGPDGFVLERYESTLFRLWKTDSAGNGATPLTSGGTHAEDRTPSWSPLSDRVVFVRKVNEAGDGRIWTVDADGANAAEVPNQPAGDNTEPDWGFGPQP